MARQRWPGQQNGPDWTDVLILMQALEALHGVSVALTLVPGLPGGSGFSTHITAVIHEESGSVMGTPVLDLSGEWPCKDHRDLVACLFAGLYDLDYQLGRKLWRQSELPFTAEGPPA